MSDCASAGLLLSSVLEEQLQAHDYFVELRVLEGWLAIPEVGPGMDVVGQQFDVVAFEVVVEAGGDGMDVIVG